MKIDIQSIDKLIEAPYNPRKDLKPGDKEYDKLKQSIEHFGYVEPIIINDRTGYIVGGHQRLKVLQDLGYTEVEVVHVDLDENNEKALNIALNKVSCEWDADKLEDLLRELNLADDFDVELTGFDMGELDTLFSGAIESLDSDDTDEDFDIDPDSLSDDFELRSGDKNEIGQMKLTLHNKQIAVIKFITDYVIDNNMISETFGNTNKLGNAVYEVVKEWAELKKLNLK